MSAMDIVCEHCGKHISKYAVKKHIDSCILNPVMQTLIAQWLPDPLFPGYARTMSGYDNDTPANPSREHIMRHYGTWNAVATAFGLATMDGRIRRIADKEVATGVLMRRLSQELHGGLYAPTRQEYVAAAHPKQGSGEFDIGTLIQRFDTWEGALSHFGINLALPPAKCQEFVKEPWEKHRATYTPVQVTLPAWSLKYGFRGSE